jgi:hypothetical protein
MSVSPTPILSSSGPLVIWPFLALLMPKRASLKPEPLAEAWAFLLGVTGLGWIAWGISGLGHLFPAKELKIGAQS